MPNSSLTCVLPARLSFAARMQVLADDTDLASNNISEAGFLVVMAKGKVLARAASWASHCFITAELGFACSPSPSHLLLLPQRLQQLLPRLPQRAQLVPALRRQAAHAQPRLLRVSPYQAASVCLLLRAWALAPTACISQQLPSTLSQYCRLLSCMRLQASAPSSAATPAAPSTDAAMPDAAAAAPAAEPAACAPCQIVPIAGVSS